MNRKTKKCHGFSKIHVQLNRSIRNTVEEQHTNIACAIPLITKRD